MEINADFSQAAYVTPETTPWRPSPQPGVERLMLDRIGDEVARATSLVRYAADSRFPEHAHERGEEFLVLDGIFSDASGDFGPGAYVRNPPGTAHAPGSGPGATIFVKLRQFAPEDGTRVVVDSNRAAWRDGAQGGSQSGIRVLPLHTFGEERVRLLRLAPGATMKDESLPGGMEILVIDGGIDIDGARYGKWAWIRLPPGASPTLRGGDGGTIYVKTGHLRA